MGRKMANFCFYYLKDTVSPLKKSFGFILKRNVYYCLHLCHSLLHEKGRKIHVAESVEE
jgi:hypothetical protein